MNVIFKCEVFQSYGALLNDYRMILLFPVTVSYAWGLVHGRRKKWAW